MATADEGKMTEKQMLNLHKQRLLRQQFMEFLLKQVAEVTYQYNCFENTSLLAFATAMEVAERFRSTLPLKKSEKAKGSRIWCFKTMLETADTMERMETNLEYVRILRRLLDMHGRLRCTANVAADFIKTLEKTGGDAEYLDKAKNSVEHWKGLCLRSFDYSNVSLFQIDQIQLEDFDEETEEDDPEMEEMRLKYLAWPLSVRTGLFIATQYLRRVSIASDTPLFPKEYCHLMNSMANAPFVTAFNIDEALFEAERAAAKGNVTAAAMLILGGPKEDPDEFRPKPPADVDPKLMKCIDSTGALLVIENEPFKEPPKAPKKGKGDAKKKKK